MQTWPLPSSSASSTKALSSKSSQKKALFQISAEKDDASKSPMWFLPFLTAEINDLLLVNNNKQKITLLISSDNNSACYTAQALASLNSGGANVVSATMLSVIRNKPMILDFAKKYNKENGNNNSSENNTTEYMNLLRIAASGRGVSTSSAKSLVIVTTVEALASRSRAILNAPYLEESKNNSNSLDDDVKSTKSVNNAEQLAATLGNLCNGCDLICLPGVDLEFAEACSSSSSSKLVFIKEQQQQQNTEVADASPKAKKKPAAKPAGKKSTSSVSKSASAGDQQAFTELKLASSSSSLQPHPELSQSGVFAWHFDDEATTLLLCCNNVPTFLKRLRILHGGQGENIENCLAAALLGAWCSSSSFALHIRLAHMFRHLLDRSGSIDKATGEIRSTESATHLTLRVQAARAISIVASKAEPLSSPNCQPLIKQMIPRSVNTTSSKNSTTNNTTTSANPFLFRAICSFAVGVAPHAALDKLCAAWGVEGHLVAGTTACKQAKRKQGALIHSLRMRYQTAHGDAEVGFVEFVCHMLIDQVSKMAAVSVGEVRSWLMWDVFFAPIYGRLTKFLRLIGILRATKTQNNTSRTSILAGGEDEDKNSNNNNKNNNKNMTYDFDEDLHPVDTPEDNKLLLSIPRSYKTATLNTKQLPLHTAHERKEKMLHDAACEELLSAMPQRRVPMYIGDVGNLIGAWTKFNAKYEGRLGWTLTDFLMEHPDKFRVMNNLVLRVSESTHEPVRVRFDHTRLDEYADDEENDFVNDRDERTKKQRREDEEIASMGGKKKIHTQRQRKKAVKAARNKKRFDRNRKEIAQDAKVPGYNKPKAKKLSGRGKKTNARNWKRS